MTTLITGATGTIGRRLVDTLLVGGTDVRALTRDPSIANLPPGAQLVRGSLASATPAVFDGIDALFLFPADAGVQSFVDQAVAAGVSRIVVLSSLAVSGRNARDSASSTAVHHREVEEIVTSATDDWTLLRPGNFANNLLFWAYAIRSGFPVRMPYPQSSQVLIHEKDIAAAAARTICDPRTAGQVLELSGPASLTKVDQLATISEAIGHEVPFVEISPDEFRTDMAQYMPSDIIEMLLRYWSETVDEPETPLSSSIAGGAASLREWALDHRDAFLP